MFGFVHQVKTEVTRQRRARRLMEDLALARERGIGLYVREWGTGEGASQPHSADALAAAVVAWCRDTLSGTRRPWGIADFDIALSTDCDDGSSPRSLSLKGLAPGDLYPGDSFTAEVHRFLAERESVAHLAVALFSWGDATHEALGSP